MPKNPIDLGNTLYCIYELQSKTGTEEVLLLQISPQDLPIP